ncbi:MAG: thiamine-phosphate kinase [Hyphomicrobiaceae bacterium]|nr:thiamine-phosphate kinase [Hyphomicrobiaceae bacterium]
MTLESGEPLHGEEAIIQEYLAPLAAGYAGALGLKDDCAILSPTPGHDVVLKTDPVAGGIHFLPDDDPANIGWKALAVNVSDLAAKGATPRAYLMALSFPEAPTRAWMARFASGLAEAQTAFGIQLAGGDTDRRPGPVTISITVLGEVPTGRMVRRATAKPGDILYVTGWLGDAALGLRLIKDPGLASRWGISTRAADAAVARFLRPQPRLAIREPLLAHARAAMDLSDGLVKDLGRMAAASGCGALVSLGGVPLSDVGAAAVAADDALWSAIAASGDDYEVLIAVPPEGTAAFESSATTACAAARPSFGITRIGEMTAAGGVALFKPDGRPYLPPRAGWDHF